MDMIFCIHSTFEEFAIYCVFCDIWHICRKCGLEWDMLCDFMEIFDNTIKHTVWHTTCPTLLFLLLLLSLLLGSCVLFCVRLFTCSNIVCAAFNSIHIYLNVYRGSEWHFSVLIFFWCKITALCVRFPAKTRTIALVARFMFLLYRFG